MLKRFFPCAYAKDVFSIDYQALYDNGYRGILFDVDNTLVHHNDGSNPEIDMLLRRVNELGLKVVLLSNNSEARLARFAETNGAVFVAEAGKPEPDGYEKAMALLDVSKKQALMIGDQMFVDICGANRVGIDSIMVHFVVKNKRAWIGFHRCMEKLILIVFRMRKARHKLGYAILER